MRQANPVVIPRNYHMEKVIEACLETNEPDAAEAFLKVLASPYKVTAATTPYQKAPEDADIGYQTFCGT